MRQAEPPSCQSSSKPKLFLIGRDSRGNWVAQDQQGLCGGLFVSRAEAMRFVRLENGNRPCAVVMVPGVLEIDLGKRSNAPPPAVGTASAPLRRVA